MERELTDSPMFEECFAFEQYIYEKTRHKSLPDPVKKFLDQFVNAKSEKAAEQNSGKSREESFAPLMKKVEELYPKAKRALAKAFPQLSSDLGMSETAKTDAESGLPATQEADKPTETAVIRIEDIGRLSEYQCREKMNKEVVAEYYENIKRGAEYPAVTVYRGKYGCLLTDGFHTCAALEKLGREEVIANIYEGTERDALLAATGANQTHGLPRSNADKRRAVKKLLAHEEFAQWSERRIAKHVGVSNAFVNKLRKELTVNGEQSTIRTGADGRTIDTANIGKEKSNCAKPATAPRKVESKGPTMPALDEVQAPKHPPIAGEVPLEVTEWPELIHKEGLGDLEEDVLCLREALDHIGLAREGLSAVVRGWRDEPGPDVDHVVERVDDAAKALAHIRETLGDELVPASGCPKCPGPECDRCHGAGWLSKAQLSAAKG